MGTGKRTPKRPKAEKNATAPGVPPEVWSSFEAILKGAELKAVHLISSSSRYSGEDASMQMEITIPNPQYRYNLLDSGLYCGLKFTARIHRPGNVNEPAVSVEAEYVLHYTMPAGIELKPEAVEAFATHNAIFNAWPFFRELAHSLVARMGIPALVIPLLRTPLRAPGQEIAQPAVQ